MVDVNIISTTREVFNLYLKQKTEFHFTQKSDNDFMLFLLDTAVRVISIAQHLSPVIEAVTDTQYSNTSDPSLLDNLSIGSKRPCIREPENHIDSQSTATALSTSISPEIIDQQIMHHSSEFKQLEKELETLTQSLAQETSSPTTTPATVATAAATAAAAVVAAAVNAENTPEIPKTEDTTVAQKEVFKIKEEVVEEMDSSRTEAVTKPSFNGSGSPPNTTAINKSPILNSNNSQITMNEDAARLNAVLQSVSLGSLSQLGLAGPSVQASPSMLSGARAFDCSFCDYVTLDKMDYVQHIREHTGSKPFTCKICDYKTDHRGNLLIHMRTHNQGNEQGRLYHCKLCSFRTSRRMYLHEHMESHAVEEKPYVCLLCDYRTSRKANLGIHMGSQKHMASMMKAKAMSVSTSTQSQHDLAKQQTTPSPQPSKG